MIQNIDTNHRVTKHVRIDPWLIAILFLAALLRLAGTAWGQPDPIYDNSTNALGQTGAQVIVDPDEYMFTGLPYKMTAIRDFNPHFFANPSFYINLNALIDVLSGNTANYPPLDKKIGLRQIAPFTVYPTARILSALMGVLSTAFIYGAARRLFNPSIARLTALLLAVAFADVQYAHYATANGTAATMLCGSLWAATRLLQEKPHLRDYLLAGSLVGLAASTKYNAGLIGVFYVFCGVRVFWHTRQQRTQPLSASVRNFLQSPFIFGFGAMALAFWLGTPYSLFDPRTFVHDVLFINGQYIGGQGYPETSNAFPLYVVYGAWFGIGLVAALCMIPGLWAIFRTRLIGTHQQTRFAIGSLLVFLAVYAFVVLRGRRLGDQLVVPILGPCAIIAAVGAYWLWTLLSKCWTTATTTSHRLKTLAALALMALFIAAPLAYSINFDRLVTLPDTRQLAQAWIYTHIPRGAHIHLTGAYNVPLASADYVTSQTFSGDQRPLDQITEARGASVLVISDAVSFQYTSANWYIPAPYAAQQTSFEQQLTQGLTLIAQFKRPRWPGDDNVITTASYFHDPTISIYCLNPNCMLENTNRSG